MKTEKQTKKELQEFIKRNLPFGRNLTVDMVKKWVFEENGAPLQASHEFQRKFMEYFDGSEADPNNVLQMSMECWNAFPHKTLNGKSPNQMIEDYRSKK